jgi:hypothetical protein
LGELLLENSLLCTGKEWYSLSLGRTGLIFFGNRAIAINKPKLPIKASQIDSLALDLVRQMTKSVCIISLPFLSQMWNRKILLLPKL